MKKLNLILSLAAGFSVNAFAQEVKVDMSASICNKTASQYFNFKFDSSNGAGLYEGQSKQIYLEPKSCQDISFWMTANGVNEDSLQFTDLWTPGSIFNIQGISSENKTISTYVAFFKLPSQYAYKETIGSNARSTRARTLQINIIDKPKSGFIEINHDCVRDEASGLIWAKNANLFSYGKWYDLKTKVNDMNNKPDSSGYKLCGYNDWRLPTIAEMKALVAHGKLYGAPDSSINDWFNLNGFNNVQPLYWSSSLAAGGAWKISLNTGNIVIDQLDYAGYVWPVRGGQR